jgi:Protein of unknown function (DUF3014)
MRNQDSFWMWGAGLVVLIAAAGAALYVNRDRAPSNVEPVVTAPSSTSSGAEAPRPVPVAPPQTSRNVPLPPLDQSDADVQGGITELVGNEAVTQYLKPERIVRNAVVTIDNLTREKLALNQRPIKPTGGQFIATGPDESLVIAKENYDRYKPFVAAVKRIDAQTLVSLYRGIQPLFQQAYEDLGNPNRLFNARLLEVIDHLLQTPDVQEPVRLVRPSVYYRYADPKLESLSSGQKLLIRMGPENAGAIKAKLREIQAALS